MPNAQDNYLNSARYGPAVARVATASALAGCPDGRRTATPPMRRHPCERRARMAPHEAALVPRLATRMGNTVGPGQRSRLGGVAFFVCSGLVS
jgi:hypothetical protein